eukprot:scaffold6822_cov121-Skeletonema_dohrnii-CCMP3373.AAC.5
MNILKQPPGAYIRWITLLGILSYFLYFIIVGIKSDPPSSNAVYICDTYNLSELTQCEGLDDETSCANLVDADGNEATCIQSSCGYKLFDHLDVSVAGTSDPYSSEDANDPTSFLSVMSIFYGLVPYLVGFIYGVSFLLTGSLVPLTRLVVLGVIVVINDEILKKVVVQKRPIGSCLYFKSFGMPSGHAATSIGLLTYLLLELFVLHPNLMCGLTCQKKGGDRDDVYFFAWGYGWQKRENSNTIDIEEDGDNVGEFAAVTNGSANGEEKIVDVEAGNPSNDSNANVSTSVQSSLQGSAIFEGLSLRPFQEPSPAWLSRGDLDCKYLNFWFLKNLGSIPLVETYLQAGERATMEVSDTSYVSREKEKNHIAAADAREACVCLISLIAKPTHHRPVVSPYPWIAPQKQPSASDAAALYSNLRSTAE